MGPDSTARPKPSPSARRTSRRPLSPLDVDFAPQMTRPRVIVFQALAGPAYLLFARFFGARVGYKIRAAQPRR